MQKLAPRAFAAVAVAVGSVVGIAVLAASVRRLLADGVARVDDAVAAGVLALGVVLLAWYLLTSIVVLACLGLRAAGRAWSAGERRLVRAGAPVLRRLLGAGAGAAVAAAAVVAPVAAAPTPSEIGDDLGWGAYEDASAPEEPDAGTPSPPAATDPTTDERSETPPVPGGSPGRTHHPGSATPLSQPQDSAPEPDDLSYTVVAGDSLWAIAADHLPAAASPADIAAAWPNWYELNLDVIGSDPDLIHPGQVLVAPDNHLEEDT